MRHAYLNHDCATTFATETSELAWGRCEGRELVRRSNRKLKDTTFASAARWFGRPLSRRSWHISRYLAHLGGGKFHAMLEAWVRQCFLGWTSGPSRCGRCWWSG